MKRLIKSFDYAIQGIKLVVRTEANMKIHIGVAIFVVVLGFLFRISHVEWLACVLCIGLVFSAEIMNTAIETLVDMISPEKNAIAGKIKDMAAGSVLIAALMSIVVGVIIFIPKILQFFWS